MKIVKKLISILLCLMMVAPTMVVATSAAGGAANVSMTVSAEEVNIGDTVTVTVSHSNMTVSSFATYVQFDNTLLECISVVGPYASMGAEYERFFFLTKANTPAMMATVTTNVVSTATEANDNSQAGFTLIGTEPVAYAAQDVFILTFTAKAAGTVTFTLGEDSSGTDGFKNSVETKDLTIIDPTPACTHEKTTTVYAPIDGQEKHTVTVTCKACGEQIGETTEVACSGGIANCQSAAICGDCGASYGEKDMNNHTGTAFVYTNNGETHTKEWACCGTDVETVPHSYDDYECDCEVKFTGWDGDLYVEEGAVKKTGWTKIGDAWYYLDPTTGNRAEGLVRVPYPAEAINGITYAPNADDLAYWESHQSTSKYSDAETAVFVFDESGKFVQDSGIVNENQYAVNGCVAWHVGFVKIDNDYYYFSGDKENNGGNVMVIGRINASRDFNSGKPVEGTTIYYFGADGKLLNYEGVTEIDEVLYYFDSNNKLACGKGLTEVEGGYVYVRSSGQLAIGAYYTNGVKYEFDANGFTVGAKNGIIDGAFYENGRRKFGLIEYNGDIYYFRTGGGFAVGEYYISNTNGMEGFSKGDKLVFGEDGKMIAVKDGIVEEDGVFYYYKDNHLQCGAGVVEMIDDQGETFYIYVRSNGQLATGKYWPTTCNGFLERGEYDWGTDGKYYPGT